MFSCTFSSTNSTCCMFSCIFSSANSAERSVVRSVERHTTCSAVGCMFSSTVQQVFLAVQPNSDHDALRGRIVDSLPSTPFCACRARHGPDNDRIINTYIILIYCGDSAGRRWPPRPPPRPAHVAIAIPRATDSTRYRFHATLLAHWPWRDVRILGNESTILPRNASQ